MGRLRIFSLRDLPGCGWFQACWRRFSKSLSTVFRFPVLSAFCCLQRYVFVLPGFIASLVRPLDVGVIAMTSDSGT